MNVKPFISRRKTIKRGDDPPSEDTHTLVLTSPLKTYVDIRLWLPLNPRPPLEQLQWAFAGPSVSTPASATSPAHTKWTHWVDSINLEEIEDEGWMFPIEGTRLVLEKGKMDFKDAKGRGVEKYEELWEDLEEPLRMERNGWVCMMVHEHVGEKGMCVRVGDWVQGLARVGVNGMEVTVVRWKLEETGWVKELEIGQFPLRSATFNGRSLKVGEVIESIGGLQWKCIETFNWDCS